MNDAPNDMTTGPDDEVTYDPEVTSAADGQWLAELRANAKSSRRPMSELLDDETVGADGDTMDAIRAAVQATRQERDRARPDDADRPADVRPGPTPDPATDPATDHDADPADDDTTSDDPDALPGSIRRETPSILESDAPSWTTLNTTSKRPSMSVGSASPSERWEPPARLAPTMQVEPPATLTEAQQRSSSLVRVAPILAVAIVALVIAVLVWSRTGDTPDEPPVDSVGGGVVDIEERPIDPSDAPPREGADR